MTRTLVIAALLALAAGCGSRESKAPWLTYPGVASHVFPLVGTPHDPTAPGSQVTCQACHPSTTFATFVCITCHVNPATNSLHPGLTGYAYQNASCYGCHPKALGVAPASHPSFFPIGAGSKHDAVGCSQCHTDLANPHVATNFQCGTCHLERDPDLATRHTTSTSNPTIVVQDYAPTSDACLRCHADSQVNRTASHPGGNGTPPHRPSLENPYGIATCTTCHDTYRTDKPFGADFTTNPASWPVASLHGCYAAGCHITTPGGGN